MIKDPAFWAAWETHWPWSKSARFSRWLRLYEAMYRSACKHGAFTLDDCLDDLVAKVRLARMLNSLPPNPPGETDLKSYLKAAVHWPPVTGR